MSILERVCTAINIGALADKVRMCRALQHGLNVGDIWAKDCTPPAGGSPPNGSAARDAFNQCCAI